MLYNRRKMNRMKTDRDKEKKIGREDIHKCVRKKKTEKKWERVRK